MITIKTLASHGSSASMIFNLKDSGHRDGLNRSRFKDGHCNLARDSGRADWTTSGRLTNWTANRSTDWLTNWAAYWGTDWRTDCLACWLAIGAQERTHFRRQHANQWRDVCTGWNRRGGREGLVNMEVRADSSQD